MCVISAFILNCGCGHETHLPNPDVKGIVKNSILITNVLWKLGIPMNVPIDQFLLSTDVLLPFLWFTYFYIVKVKDHKTENFSIILPSCYKIYILQPHGDNLLSFL